MKQLICLFLSAMLLLCGCSGREMMELEGGAVTAESVSPYAGLYLEHGDREQVADLFAMRFTNTGERTIREAQFTFTDGQRELSFHLEMLPADQSVLVAEYHQQLAAGEELRYVDGYISYLEDGLLKQRDCVALSQGPDGSLKIRNATLESLPLVRIFYRPTNAKGELLGGPCASVMAEGIPTGGTVTILDSDWDESCKVVAVLVVNE